jgi:ethanolamine utilization protein EutN
MQLAYVIGRLITTAKDRGYGGKTLLILQPVKTDGTRSKDFLIATDSIGAGAGELVMWVKGKEASFPFLPEEIAVDATVIGIIDGLDVKDKDNQT